MLSPEDNELLVRTGRGTAMGTLFRRFWMPAALSQELPEPGGAPLRVRLLGEDLLAFRGPEGRIGLVDPRCPHRGANLYWGRNEPGGLRCVYHGWKFDTDGRCVAMPTVPEDRAAPFRERVRLASYPTREWGDLVWAWMGPTEAMSPLPAMEFATLPASHRFVSKKLQQCNWAQACEGGLDTAHFSFLHMAVGDDDDELMSVLKGAEAGAQRDRARWLKRDPMPRFTVVPHDAGLVLGASRNADDGALYWRISQFLVPNHGLAPSAFPGDTYHGQTWVPIDDTSCWVYCYSWNPDRPLTDAERAKFRGGHSIHAEVDAHWVPVRNRSNDYLIDREQQRHHSYTGIAGVSEQDACIQDSQGLIADRTLEHLGPTDLGIVRFRQLMLGAAKALAQGTEPTAAAHQDAYDVRSGGTVCPAGWSFDDVMRSRFGDPHGRIASNGATRTPAPTA